MEGASAGRLPLGGTNKGQGVCEAGGGSQPRAHVPFDDPQAWTAPGRQPLGADSEGSASTSAAGGPGCGGASQLGGAIPPGGPEGDPGVHREKKLCAKRMQLYSMSAAVWGLRQLQEEGGEPPPEVAELVEWAAGVLQLHGVPEFVPDSCSACLQFVMQ